MNVGIFGGSFNPPHLAHVLAVTTVLSTHDLEKVIVIPTFEHPFGKVLAPYADRIAMCELGLGWLPRVEVSRIEETLGGTSRTLRTLEHLRATYPEWNMRMIVGADIVLEADKWHGFASISALAPLIVLGRVGVDVPEGLGLSRLPASVLPNVSSTAVREWLSAGAWDALEDIVPRTVLRYIQRERLYPS